MDFARMMQTGALPTNLEELSQRIDELKTVEQWLSFNLQLLRATIQGMEVQQGTLQTLKSMQDSFGAGFGSGSGVGSGAAHSRDSEPSASATEAGRAWWDAVQKQFSQMALAAQAFHAAGSSNSTAEPHDAGPTKSGSRQKSAGGRDKAKGKVGGRGEASPDASND